MPSAAAHARSILTSSTLSLWQVKHMVPLQAVLAALNAAKVEFVIAGAHAIGGYTKKPRATVDIDVVIAPRAHKKAVKALRGAFPGLIVRDIEVVTRFVDPGTKEAVIDLMKPKDNLLKTIFENSVAVRLEGQAARIPDLEMAAATKFAAMIGAYRKLADKEQDAVDFRRIVEANVNLDVDRLARLGDLVYSGGGNEVRGLVRAVRDRKPLVF